MKSSFILSDIRNRLALMRTEQDTVDTFRGLFVFSSLLFLLTISLTLTEATFHFSGFVRTILVPSSVLLTLVAAGWFFVRPMLRLAEVTPSASDFELASRVGDFFPTIRDRLLNLLQLQKELEAGTSRYSPELIDASFYDLRDAVRSIDFEQAVDQTPLRVVRKNFLVVAIACVALFIMMPITLLEAANRLIFFGTEFIPPAQYVFEVSPGNKEVVKGENVTIAVRVSSSIVSPATLQRTPISLLWNKEGQTKSEEITLRADSNDVYQTILAGLRTTTEYYVRLDGVESESYKLVVIDRPMIRSFQIRLDYPSYTKLQPRLQDEFVGDIAALAGTRATATAISSKNLKDARIVFDNRTSTPMNIRGERFSTTFTIQRDGSYHVDVMDHEGLNNTDPVEYQVRLIPDESPTVAILFPGRNLDLAGDKSLPLLLQIKDDFGFSQLRLGYRIAHSRYEEITPHHTFVAIPLPSEITTLGEVVRLSAHGEVRFRWDLSRLKLVPEEVVEYFVEVFDNDAVNGPKAARSQFYLLRLPSLEEVFTDLKKGHEQSLDDLRKTLEEAKELKEKLETINQDLKKNKDFDWQQQKKVEEMAKKYQELQKKLDKVQQKVDEIVQQMQQHNVLSDETMQKYLELQQLMQQLDSAELEQLLKQMQQAMQNINKDQIQQALQQMTFSEERFRQSIERTMNLLKRIQIEQKLDELKKRAEQLRQTQDQLEQRANENERGKESDLARQQEDLVRQQQELERQAKDLEERMEEFFTEMPLDKLQQLNEKLRQQQLSEQMRKAASQLKQGQWQQAQQMQRQIGQQLQEYAEQLDALQQEMLQQQSQYVINELRKATNNLLELSKQEELLKQQSQSAPSNSLQLRQNAQDQMRVMQDLRNVVNSLSELSQRSFAVTPGMGRAISDALNRMQNAMRSLDIRNGAMASQEQQAAMAALNRAATQVQQAMQAMMQAQGSGGGLMQQLQMMAGQQMGINMQTQQLGDGMSQQRAADAARLAMEQEAIRKSLEQLNREAQTSGDREKILGDLERIADEMREVVTNLEQNQVNPETIQKQERILSRLLDASRSMRERDFEKRRKAQTGTQIARKSPSDIDPASLEGQNRLREDLLKAIEQGYSKDYQELIRKYFEELQKIRRPKP